MLAARHQDANSSISPIPPIRPAPISRNAEVRRLHAGLPRNVILVIDAAYAEFVRRNDYESGIEMVAISTMS